LRFARVNVGHALAIPVPKIQFDQTRIFAPLQLVAARIGLGEVGAASPWRGHYAIPLLPLDRCPHRGPAALAQLGIAAPDVAAVDRGSTVAEQIDRDGHQVAPEIPASANVAISACSAQ